MIGDLYINGKDAWVTWGVALEEESDNKLLLGADNKPYTSIDSRSHPGKQVFIDNPQPKDRDVLLVFQFSAENRQDFLIKYRAFLAEINAGFVSFRVPMLGEEYKFTCQGYQELNNYEELGKLSVRFNEPNPKDRIYL